MPETPDFGQMARSTTGFIRVDPEAKDALELNIIDLLRQVWNARGAADRSKLEATFYGPVDPVIIREVDGRRLDDALGSLDL